MGSSYEGSIFGFFDLFIDFFKAVWDMLMHFNLNGSESGLSTLSFGAVVLSFIVIMIVLYTILHVNRG